MFSQSGSDSFSVMGWLLWQLARRRQLSNHPRSVSTGPRTERTGLLFSGPLLEFPVPESGQAVKRNNPAELQCKVSTVWLLMESSAGCVVFYQVKGQQGRLTEHLGGLHTTFSLSAVQRCRFIWLCTCPHNSNAWFKVHSVPVHDWPELNPPDPTIQKS